MRSVSSCFLILLLTALSGAISVPLVSQDLGDVGVFPKWSRVEIEFTGPASIGMSEMENPFEIWMYVTFTAPSGSDYVVPAFYDGDGIGGMDGSVWKVRFSPSELGTWSFFSASDNLLLDGYSGTLAVAAPPGSAQYFAKWGRLEYVGGHFLKFADGPYWIKGGADDPEDLLGPGVMGDWDGKRQAVDYLASKGVNSMYIMLQNVNGDGDNVWPWASRLDSDHFDLAKLDDWEGLFDHIQSSGVVLHLVLEDDEGWTGFNRDLYYREMIARFGHYNGLIWNISEEYDDNYTAAQVKSFAQQLRDLDAFNHPVTVHHAGGLSEWSPFLGDDRFDLTSFQTRKAPQNPAAVEWREDSSAAGRSIPISFDETGKIASADREVARQIIWSVYLGGAVFELHTSPLTRLQDFERLWDDMRRAREFMESMPFWSMAPANDLVGGGTGRRYCLRKAGVAYAIYLEEGGNVSLDLSAEANSFKVRWFNPRTGESAEGPELPGGGIHVLGSPPFPGDAAALVSSDLFSDGFESGDTSDWSYTVFGERGPALPPTVPR